MNTIKNTLDFTQWLDNRSLNEKEVLVSYDVTSLFTQIPLEETIDYILDQIYICNKLPAITGKLIFKRLLYKVTKGSVFSFNGSLYRQVDGCGMGNPLSPVLANIFMCKLENDVLPHHTLAFYDRYVDDCFAKRRPQE